MRSPNRMVFTILIRVHGMKLVASLVVVTAQSGMYNIGLSLALTGDGALVLMVEETGIWQTSKYFVCGLQGAKKTISS